MDKIEKVGIYDTQSRAYAIEYFNITVDAIIDKELGDLLSAKAEIVLPPAVTKNFTRESTVIELKGYFGYLKYFQDLGNKVHQFLAPSSIFTPSQSYKKMKEKIKKVPNSVCVHVRMGDLANYYSDGNRILPLNYQLKGMSLIQGIL